MRIQSAALDSLVVQQLLWENENPVRRSLVRERSKATKYQAMCVRNGLAEAAAAVQVTIDNIERKLYA